MATVTLAREAMATRFEVVLHGENSAHLRAAGETALAEVERLENQLSLYRPSSEIAQVNARAAHQPVRVSPPVFQLLTHCARLSQETGGTFDITVAPLVRSWGFMNAQGHWPAPEAIAAARQSVGMEKVSLNPDDSTVHFTQPGVMLDLGAIGKGYAIDRGIELLRDAGVTSALFHGGTSTAAAIGHPPEADAWSLALPPQATDLTGKHFPALQLRDAAVSVSAVWGRSFMRDGKIIGHVIDPRTGEPVSHATMSAVVLENATETDALSTALLVLGTDGMETIQRLRSGLRAVILGSDGQWDEFPKTASRTPGTKCSQDWR